MLIIRLLFLLTFAGGLLLAPADAAPGEREPVSLAELEAEIAALLENAGTPGAVVAVIENGETVLSKGFGVANRATGAPMTAQTLVAAGSLSKNLTSLGALVLVDEGKLALNDRIIDRAPEVSVDNPWRAEHPILIEHLLEHTAGIEGSTYYEYGFNKPDVSPREYAQLMAGKIEVRWPPGFFYSYANPGHTLIGAAIENICDCSFDTFMAEKVFGPLSMSDATFSLTPEDEARLAQSYRVDGETPSARWLMAIRPSGSLVVTVNDLARLVTFYATRSNGPPILSPALLDRMENAEASALARAGVVEGGYSLGNFGFYADKGRIFHGHTGSTEGFRTWLGYDPEIQSGFAVVTTGGPENMRYDLMHLIGGYLTRDLQPATPLPAQPGAEGFVQPGWYSPFTHEMPLRSWMWQIFSTVKLTPDGDQLIVDSILPTAALTQLIHVGDGLFRSERQPLPRAGFVKDASGGVVFVNGLAYEPVSVWTAYGRFYFLIGALIVSGVAVIHAVVWVAMRVLGRLQGGAGVRLRAALFASGASLLGVISLFVAFGMLADLDVSATLGRISTVSLGLAALSVIGPLALVYGIFTWRLVSTEGLVFRYYSAISIVLMTGAWGLLALSGWTPLITWRI
ncbi:MAG: serine hydrolase domain-containing protein [Pseudomonadota bacterium]